MLTLIRIANYAIIDEVELELEPGFSVMTGETGAGKSILVDALGLALGDRADSTAVRAGAKRAEVSVLFDIPGGHAAMEWLRERELHDGSECALRRMIGADGRSRAFVNGQPVTLEDLRALGGMLIDIHGQHAHQSLVNTPAQRAILDASGGLSDLALRVAKAFETWQETAALYRERQDRSANREAEIERLRFQLDELRELALEPQETERLQAERSRLANVDRLLQTIDGALDDIYESDEGAAHARVARARAAIEGVIEHDPELTGTLEQLARAEIELNDVATGLVKYRDRLEADPARLEHVETRLAKIRSLARRYRVAEAELVGVAEKLKSALDDLDSSSQSIDQLAKDATAAKKVYFDAAEKLSEKRKHHAAAFGKEVSSQLKELGLPSGEFRAVVEGKPSERADGTGIDRVEFQVQLNPGQPFGSIARAASGGELSRISLALEVVATDASTIPTFVFDEVDAGIGGGVAEIVGRRLKQIAEYRQVLCVTHLPQVASQGEHHLRILKTTDGRTSRTRVDRLAADERIEELSRMLGGVEITETTRAHAAEMMQGAAQRP